jgi:Flp pilus assembly protein TadD
VSPAVAVGILLLLAPQAGPRPAGAAAAPSPAPAVGPTFEELLAAFARADAAGDVPAVTEALREIRRTRIERNVESLDTVALGLVGRGVARLDAGQREEAEEAFRTAVALAPGLPDGHAGLATALLKRGPLGVIPSVEAALSGLSAFLSTGRGAARVRDLATAVALLATFAVGWALGIALLLRHGGLLRHDLEEWMGPAQSRSASLALFLLVLLLPVATFQGWGWLPLWWLALLLTYLAGREKALAGALLAATIAVGPVVASLDLRLRTTRNALYGAALASLESSPSPREIARLEEAAREDPGDRDLVHLLGVARRRAGRYEEAAELYRQVLAADAGDAVARNNLANIEFVRGGYDAARARYRAGTTGGVTPEVAATSYYNLSLVHLQKFEYQAYNEARSNADRLAPGLVAAYERWKYDSGDYAVVDLGLSRRQVWEKFAGAASGVGVRNVGGGGRRSGTEDVAGSLVNRFTLSALALAVVALVVARLRGPKAFTLHCGRCGTAFCRSCHLGPVSGGLCSQCYHLFVVRDGVSGPARNRKMVEAQAAEARRDRISRMLSVLSPGTGQVYGGWTLRGTVLVGAWYGVLALVAANSLVPFTEVSRRLSPPWFLASAGLALLAVWVVANRFRPGRDVELPARPGGPRRARPAAE